MRLKENKDIPHISKQRLQEVYAEEYREVIAERLREYFKNGGTIDEGFLDKIKGGAKGFMKGYGKLIKNYGEFVADLYGYNSEEEIPDEQEPPSPEEMQQAVATGEVDEIDKLMADLQKKMDALKTSVAKSDGEEDDARFDKMDQFADKMDAAATGSADPSAGGGEPAEPQVSAALLDILDVSMEKWEKIRGATKDAELQKAMDKVEQIALAEKLKRMNLKGRRK